MQKKIGRPEDGRVCAVSLSGGGSAETWGAVSQEVQRVASYLWVCLCVVYIYYSSLNFIKHLNHRNK